MYRSLVVLLLAALAAASPSLAVDTLRVTTPDPVLEEWRWTTFERNSAQDGSVRDVHEDRDGNIWLATDRGAHRYDGYHWTTYRSEDGLTDDKVRTVIQSQEGVGSTFTVRVPVRYGEQPAREI